MSNRKPLFTIIIPTFNSGKTISLALESVAEQTYNEIEVVVQDGLSTDNTLEVAKGFEPGIPGIRLFSEEDQGIYDAMNKALDKATGEWLIFMGSDDRFYDHTVLETVAGVAASSQTKVLYGNAKIIGDTGWAKDGDVYDGEFDVHKLLNQNICHQAMFYNAEFVKKEVGYFNLAYKKSSDWDFNLRCWARQPFSYMDTIVSFFAAGGMSTHSTDTSLVDDYVDNVLQYFNINPFHPLVNNPTFIFYHQVKKKQRQDFPLRLKFEKLKMRILKKPK